MENPADWNEVEKAINVVISQQDEDMANGVIGGSLILNIYTMLKTQGYLKDQY